MVRPGSTQCINLMSASVLPQTRIHLGGSAGSTLSQPRPDDDPSLRVKNFIVALADVIPPTPAAPSLVPNWDRGPPDDYKAYAHAASPQHCAFRVCSWPSAPSKSARGAIVPSHPAGWKGGGGKNRRELRPPDLLD